jgi:amino acid transporter
MREADLSPAGPGSRDSDSDEAAIQIVAHHGQLRANAVRLFGNIGVDLASVAPTASLALTLGAIIAVSGYASPLAILIVALPMLAIANGYRLLNRWRVNCGTTYDWGARAISPYFGFTVGWLILLAWLVGAVSIIIPAGPYIMQLFGNPNSRLGTAIVGFVGTLIITAIAFIGIRITAAVQWILIGIEYVAVVALAILSLVAVFTGTHGAVTVQWSALVSWKEMGGVAGFIGAALIAVYMFSGWELGTMLGEETAKPRKLPGTAVMISTATLAVMFAVFTFAFQFTAPKGQLESHANILEFIAQRVSGGFLAKYIILAVALSALGSCLSCFVASARISFAMGADGVLPRIFGRTSSRSKVPIAGTALVAVFTAVGVWVFPLGSSSVQNSFSTIVAIDGILFGLFYAGTGIVLAVYYRRLAMRSVWSFAVIEVFPLVSAAFLIFMAVKSVPGLGGWTGGTLISLYVMLGIGLVLLIYVLAAHKSSYFATPREVYDPADQEYPEASQAT